MLSYEKYENNVKIYDKNALKDVKVNKYVSYTGDINLLEKTCLEDGDTYKPLLANAVVGLNNTSAPLPFNLDYLNLWSEIDAQEAYLNTKAPCYLILGKPGLGSYSLGESIAKKLNCIHLSSRNAIFDEIEQKSSTGRCIDFNMRHNRVCKFEYILAILKAKIQSAVIKHRGYVISGLPLVTSSKSEQYLLNNLYAEESLAIVDDLLYDLIWNLKRKKPIQKIQMTASHSSLSSEANNVEEVIEEEQQPEIVAEEAEELLVEMPKYLLDTCSGIVYSCNISITTKRVILLQQIQELFSFEPDIIIHITCPDADTLTKKSRKFFNYMTNVNTFNNFLTTIDLEMRWPSKYTMIDYSKPYESHFFNSKYSCQQPINFLDNSVSQICNYKSTIIPFVEQKLKDFDPKYILKIDGRFSVHQMLHYIIGILYTVNIKPVVIPKPLYFEEPIEDPDEFWSTIKQNNSIKSGVLNFNRCASQWYTRCPVELQKRRSFQGNSKFAVSLFNHVYLLSSLDAMVSFCKNPRPYLKLKYLEPTCRIIIIGTKSSGKTMIAECLSWLFDTPVTCYKTFLNSEKQKKYDNFSKTILSEIIATIEDVRLMKWRAIETERETNLNTWFHSVLTKLKSYVALFEKQFKLTNEEEIIDEEHQIPENELKKMLMLKEQLSFLPILDDLDLCKEMILELNLFKYAPNELITETAKPHIPILGDEDVTEAISAYILANDLQKDIEPTTEELMREIVHILSENDRESMDQSGTYSKFIIDDFPSDPEFWSYLDEFKILPDYTISLIESKEIDIELLKSYFMIDRAPKNYQERYLLSTDPFIKIKKQQKKLLQNTILDIQILIIELVNSVLDLLFRDPEIENDNTETILITSFNEAIYKFREDWDSVKLKLEGNSKATIVVEIENKSDINMLNEVLLRVRQSYCLSCTPLEIGELEDKDSENNYDQDLLTYNDSYFLGDTNVYCPVAYYDYGVIWRAKYEFATEFDNRSYFFCKEECLDMFQKDVIKYQSFNKPSKCLPPLRICVIGSIGSGKTTLSKQLSKEMGLMHIDFEKFINSYLIPKHFKKVGRQYENSFKDTPIDEETAMEFQVGEENEKISDILFNESEIRRMIYSYFEKGTPLIPSLIQKLIKLLWCTEPFSRNGFVLDGFPKLPSDVEVMVASFCIPDIVIDLQGSSEKTLERLSSKMLKKWKVQLNEAKREVKIKFERRRKEWYNSITQEIVIKLVMDEIINSVFIDMSTTDINPEINMSVHSTIIDAHPSGSENVDANLFNMYNEIIQVKPEPVDDTEWEKAEDVLEKINSRLESIFEIDDENIQTLKEMLNEQNIKILPINGNKSAIKVFRNVLPKLSNLRNRNTSFFEQTFIINNDIAETLITEGFYLLSRFNQMCPVYIFENPHAISNPYTTCKRMNKIYPVIHRSYIYFVCSVENVQKFRKNPLKYIISDAFNSYINYPLRISIIGPPKSGKSELAAKLAKRFGLLCVSRGKAIRHVLENMKWTELAVKMTDQLLRGECIDGELIMSAVHTVTIDYRVASNGFVFDGFPDVPAESTELLKMGLYPLIVIEINSNRDIVVSNSQNEIHYPLLKYKPPYPQPFIEYRIFKWHEKCSSIKKWINDDLQNVYTICGNSSKWRCLKDATNIIENVKSKVHYYLCNVKTNVVKAGFMCFSKAIFEQRMSAFKNLCPICLCNNVIRHSDFPVDRKGLVQFKNNLYWLCPDHMELGLLHPDIYLLGTVNIPEIPVVVNTISSALLHEDGICIVTYTENLPSQKVVKGDRNIAAAYQGKHYLFCSSQCQHKFLAKPHMYYDITILKETGIFPKLALNKLPDLGYLEQTFGNVLTKACCSVNVTRPKYPGLSIRISGLLYIALYLKVHNPSIALSVLPMYEKAYRTYDARCKLIHDIRLRLRSMDNPFAKYPKCCGPRKLDSGTVSKPSSIVSTSGTASSYSAYNKTDKTDYFI